METYRGYIHEPADAIKLFEACRLGFLPRIQRRLSKREGELIEPGFVFVWDEKEAGIRRWTDGRLWSASRSLGSFLFYTEMEGKRTSGRLPDIGGSSDENIGGYRTKEDGMIKKSFHITTSTGKHLHLISYYSRTHPALSRPTTDPKLQHIVPIEGEYEAQGRPIAGARIKQYLKPPQPSPEYQKRPNPYQTGPGYACILPPIATLPFPHRQESPYKKLGPHQQIDRPLEYGGGNSQKMEECEDKRAIKVLDRNFSI